MIDASRFKFKPFAHQLDGVRLLIDRSTCALFDEMGVGKTKQIIDAMGMLWEAGQIDTVVVVAPAAVRGGWDDPDTGQIQLHSFTPYNALRFDAKFKPHRQQDKALDWYIVSYAYLRNSVDLLTKELKGKKFALVLDESTNIKSHKSQQTKACKKLRQHAVRCTILNGTPVSNSLVDLWAQFWVLDPYAIVNPKTGQPMNFFQFRNRYCLMGGYLGKQIVGYHHKEELTERLSPWILRREKKDCLDLPPKLYQTREVKLSADSWRLYTQMREDLVAWLTSGESTIASSGGVKVVRLSQITSGILGGFEADQPATRIGDEKIQAFMDWMAENHAAGKQQIVWCRFRIEGDELEKRLRAAGYRVGRIAGGQSDTVRQATINGFQDGKLDIVVGQQQAGGLGLNLTRASVMHYMSNDYSLTTRMQSEDRIHRPGQTLPCTYIDWLATSPDGRKTIDHKVHSALSKKQDLARWTTEDWRRELLTESSAMGLR